MPPTARPRTLFSLTINKAKFRKPVRPGDTLEYHVDKLAQRRNTYSYRGEAKVHGVRGGAWRRLTDCRALKLLRPMRAFAGYVLWVPPMTFLTTMAAPHRGCQKIDNRRLAEAGCSASEIMAITGHKTLAEVERYTRAAGQEQLARRAIKRQSENKSGKLVREEVANDQNDVEIASIISRVALPTGIEPVFQP